MVKLVTLSNGREFPSVSAATEHFARILKSRELKEAFSGEDLVDIRTAYADYCAKTNWTLASAPALFYPTHDRGPGYTTRCFGVTFEDGTTGNFSMTKALRAIAV